MRNFTSALFKGPLRFRIRGITKSAKHFLTESEIRGAAPTHENKNATPLKRDFAFLSFFATLFLIENTECDFFATFIKT